MQGQDKNHDKLIYFIDRVSLRFLTLGSIEIIIGQVYL